MRFTLSTDSCCDFLKGNLKKMDIDFIPLVYIDKDEPYYDNFSSIEEYQFFFNEQKRGKTFKTAGLNPYDVEEYFKEILERKKTDIVHVCLSSGLSGTCQIVKNVADNLNKINEHKIYVVDSLSATIGMQIVINQARKMRDNDLSAQTTVANLKEIISKLVLSFFVFDLETLKNGGRISPVQAAIGKMLQLRPMIHFDKEGKLQVVEKIMGNKKAIKTLAEQVIKNINKEIGEPIYILHTGNFDLVFELQTILQKELQNPTIITSYIGPVIGSHTGPNTLGVSYITK